MNYIPIKTIPIYPLLLSNRCRGGRDDLPIDHLFHHGDDCGFGGGGLGGGNQGTGEIQKGNIVVSIPRTAILPLL